MLRTLRDFRFNATEDISLVSAKDKILITNIAYRQDIDFLRGVSVILVVLFHVFPKLLPGGFIGVDVFFVISGYLITKILCEGNQTLLEFWTRRIVRILPALLFVILLMLSAGIFIYDSFEWNELLLESLSGLLFVSNILFWLQSGYFDHDAISKPLLNLWSLGVEEQFYMLWPFLIIYGAQLRKHLVVAVVLLSFSMSCYAIFAEENVFFSPFVRFWELGAGALLVLLPNVQHSNFLRVNADKIKLISLLVILICAFAIDKSINYPGIVALVPILASCFYLVANNPIAESKMNNRYLIYIGKISYPLYLIHWPIISLTFLLTEKQLGILEGFGVIVISTLIAALIFHKVEARIRNHKNYKMKAAFLIFLNLIVVFFLVFQLSSGVSIKNKMRINSEDSRSEINSVVDDGKKDNQNIHIPIAQSNEKPVVERSTVVEVQPDQSLKFKDPGNFKDARVWRFASSGPMIECGSILKDDSPTCYLHPDPYVLIIGDSHAGHLQYGFINNTVDKNFTRASVIGAGSCQPSFGKESRKNCQNVLRSSIDYLTKNASIKYVFVSSHYNFPNDLESAEAKEFLDGFSTTFQMLREQGVKIVFVVDTPMLKENAEQCAPKRVALRNNVKEYPAFCDKATTADFKERLAYDDFISRLKTENPFVTFLNTQNYFCKNGACSIYDGNKLLFYDDNHLSIYGSKFVVDRLLQNIK